MRVYGANIQHTSPFFDAMARSRAAYDAHTQAQAAAQSQQIKNQFEPQALQSALQTQLLNQQLTKAKTKNIPLSSLIAAQNALTSQGRLGQSKSRFGSPEYKLKQIISMMPKATSALLQSKYPGIMKTLAEQQMTSALQDNQGQQAAQQAAPRDLSGQIMSQLSSLGYIPQGYAQQAQTQQQNQQVQDETQPQMMTDSKQALIMPQQQAQQAPTNLSQALAARQDMIDPTTQMMGKSSLIAANKADTGTDIQQRFDASRAFEGLVNNPDVTGLMGDVAKYQGRLGKSKEWYAKNMKPEDYNKVQGFRNQLGTFLAGNITKLEALGKNNIPLQKAYSFFELAQKSLKYDPDAAVGYMNQGLKLANDEYKSIGDSAQPLGDAYGVRQSQPAHIKAQSSSVSIPTFQSKQEFQTWYQDQSPDAQSRIRSQLGGR